MRCFAFSLALAIGLAAPLGCAMEIRPPIAPESDYPSWVDLSSTLGTDPESVLDGHVYLRWLGDAANVTVTYRCRCLPEPITIRPEAQGDYGIVGLPRGHYRVEIAADGKRDHFELGFIHGGAKRHYDGYTLPGRSHVDLTQAYRAEPDNRTSVSFTVELHGRPLAHAPVSIQSPAGRDIQLWTDDEGRVSVTGLPERWPPQHPHQHARPLQWWMSLQVDQWRYSRWPLKTGQQQSISLDPQRWTEQDLAITPIVRRLETSLFFDPALPSVAGGPRTTRSVP